ncbi:MAG: response regulator [Chitinivibrionales bacterium]|nr:response regulator [Chitinivibrionales bacterium]
MAQKRTLTSGEVARFCEVNFRTVLRWIEKGMLRSYRLPGTRKDHRIKVEDLVVFLKENNMPIPEDLGPVVPRVLIVDDDKSMAKSIRRSLIEQDYDTEIAFDGFSAGTLMQRFMPSVVTLDLAMPGMGGVDVIKFIRSRPEFAHVKVLVVSARPREELEAACKAGADDMLEKPFENPVLLEKITSLMKRN